MLTIILAWYFAIGVIVTGIRIYNIYEITKYMDNFEDEIIGGQIGFVETIVKTIVIWPLIVGICLFYRGK